MTDSKETGMGTTDRRILRARAAIRETHAALKAADENLSHAENDLRDTRATIQDMSQTFKEKTHGKSDEKKPTWVAEKPGNRTGR